MSENAGSWFLYPNAKSFMHFLAAGETGQHAREGNYAQYGGTTVTLDESVNRVMNR